MTVRLSRKSTARTAKKPDITAKKTDTTAKKTDTTAKSPSDIVDKVIHYNSFKDGLNALTFILESKVSTSIVISGGAGMGKTTLIREAFKRCDVISIWMSPSHFPDDFTALKHIANELNLDPGPSISDILSDIEERYIKTDKKIVMVLTNFEEFCRKRQSLLYCLTNLTQHGDNISLIGLTYSLDCTEKLEKRVRSRINALFYHLDSPYSTSSEFIEFASLLLGGHKLEPSMKEELGTMQKIAKVSIRALKRLLIHSYRWENGKMILKNDQFNKVTSLHMDLLAIRLKSFTFSQVNLLKMIMFYCNESDGCVFTLTELSEFARKNSFKDFNSIDHLAVRNAAHLVANSFLSHTKPHKMIDRNSTLTINILPLHMKNIITNYPDLDPTKMDGIMKKIKL